jgi:hypothetical protein
MILLFSPAFRHLVQTLTCIITPLLNHAFVSQVTNITRSIIPVIPNALKATTLTPLHLNASLLSLPVVKTCLLMVTINVSVFQDMSLGPVEPAVASTALPASSIMHRVIIANQLPQYAKKENSIIHQQINAKPSNSLALQARSSMQKTSNALVVLRSSLTILNPNNVRPKQSPSVLQDTPTTLKLSYASSSPPLSVHQASTTINSPIHVKISTSQTRIPIILSAKTSRPTG